MCAIPSPTSTTVPTLRVSVAASNASISDLRIVVISSERMAMVSPVLPCRAVAGLCGRVLCARVLGARHELFAEPLEATPHACIDHRVADPDDDPADEGGIHLRGQPHFAL